VKLSCFTHLCRSLSFANSKAIIHAETQLTVKINKQMPSCFVLQSLRSLTTQEIHVGRKMDEIAKFSILDEKTKLTILDEIWTKNGQLIGMIAEKSCQILSHSLALP